MLLNIMKNKFIETNMSKDESKKLYDKIEEVRLELSYPSLQVSFIINGNYFSCSTGLSHTELVKKATLGSTYYHGSVSKIYVKGLLLKLAQEKVIGLEDLISKYIDISPVGSDVTIKHLLHHSSGFYDPTLTNSYKYTVLHLGKRWKINEIIHELRNNQSHFSPGSSHRYTNVEYILLGKIVEMATNKTFAQLLNEYFLVPLKLRDTFYSSSGEVAPKKLADGYDTFHYKTEENVSVVNVKDFPVYLPSASGYMSGGMVTNSSDLCRFMYNLFEGNLLDEHHKRVLRLFFGTKQFSGMTFREQCGYMPGYKSFIGYSASRKIAISALTNISDHELIYSAVDKIIDYLIACGWITK